jgi:hypothetical protein
MGTLIDFPAIKKDPEEEALPLAPGIRKLYLAVLYHSLVRRDKEATNKLMKFAAGAPLTGPVIYRGQEIERLVDQVDTRQLFTTLMKP